MPFDCLCPAIGYLNGETFESNLDNVFAQVGNSYLSGMNAAARYFKAEKELRELKAYLSGISYEMHKHSL